MLRKMKRAIIRGNNSGHYLHEAWRQRMFKKLKKVLSTSTNPKERMAARLRLIKMTYGG